MGSDTDLTRDQSGFLHGLSASSIGDTVTTGPGALSPGDVEVPRGPSHMVLPPEFALWSHSPQQCWYPATSGFLSAVCFQSRNVIMLSCEASEEKFTPSSGSQVPTAKSLPREIRHVDNTQLRASWG